MRTYYLFLIISFCFSACKSDGEKSTKSLTKSNSVISKAYMLTNQKDFLPQEIETMRKTASEVLALRKKDSGNKSYTVMDKDIWAFGGLVSDSRALFGDSLAGTWIDFKENLTFDYGQYDKKSGSGHYFYDMEKATLLMLDDNPAIKPQEFEVKMNNDMLVIVGQAIYKDNNMQAKLDRKATFPTKSPETVPVQ